MYLTHSLARHRIFTSFSVTARQSKKLGNWRSISTSGNFAIDMETVNTTERLKGLRDLMKKNKIDVYSM